MRFVWKLFFVGVAVFLVYAVMPGANKQHQDIQKFAKKIVKVTVNTKTKWKQEFAIFKYGELFHQDRGYWWKVVPEELNNTLLYRGLHEPAIGTSITIDVLVPMNIYIFWVCDPIYDGGWPEQFENMPDWVQLPESDWPQYQGREGSTHGPCMTTYRLNAKPGTINIPATTKFEAAFSLAFKPTGESHLSRQHVIFIN